jgi:hypothetical protein
MEGKRLPRRAMQQRRRGRRNIGKPERRWSDEEADPEQALEASPQTVEEKEKKDVE